MKNYFYITPKDYEAANKLKLKEKKLKGKIKYLKKKGLL